MHPNTKKILEDLKRMGVDTSNIETQLTTNVAADNFLGAGVTRQQEFNTIITEKRRIEAELAAAQTRSNTTGVPIDQNSLSALKTKLDSLKQFLITEEYPAEEVNNLFKDTEALLAAPQITTPSTSSNTNPNPNQQRGTTMTEEQRIALRNESAALGASLGISLQLQVQKAYSEFYSLYNRFPTTQEISALETAMAERTINGTESVDVVANDVFKFTEKRQEIADADLATKLEAAKAEGRNEVLQQHPEIATQRPRGARIAAPIASHFVGNKSGNAIPGARVSSGAVQNPPANSQPPTSQQSSQQIVNPNDPNANFRDEHGRLPFEQRGDQKSRLLHIQAVAAAKPELFEDYGYNPVYGSQGQQ